MNTMNLKKRVSFKLGSLAILLALATAQCLFAAQSVLMGPPSTPAITPAWSEEEATNNEMDVFAQSSEARKNDQPFAYGPITLRPHVTYSFSYSTGIQANTNQPEKSIIQTVSPGMSIDLGKHWTLDYTPTLTFYSNRKFTDTLNHAASLNGATSYGDWVLGLSQTFNQSTAPLAETATETEQESFVTALTAEYAINDRMSADFAINQNFNYVSGIQDSKTWSTMDWLNYSFWTRLTVGIGAGGGYSIIDADGNSGSQGGDQSFEDLQARIQWRVTDKISFSVNGGFEDRQYNMPGVDSSLNPIFGASAQYQLFKHTQLSLNASRTVSSSDYYILAESTEVTTVSASLDQRLFVKYDLNATVGYTKTDYTKSLLTASNERRDDNYFFTIRLSRSFLKRGSVGISYQYGDNKSTAQGYSYHSNQVGFDLGWAY